MKGIKFLNKVLMAGKSRDIWYFMCKNFFSFLPDSLYHNTLGFIMHKRFNAKYYWMNIKQPKTFSEKLQYLKKCPVADNLSELADKYDVRAYVKEKIGSKFLVPLVGKGIYENVEDINFADLPNQFVLKLTKGSGYNIICENKTKLNINETINQVNKWLTIKPYFMSRESQYNGKSRVICEEMLEYNITDYKFFCFHGVPKYVELFIDRQKEHKKVFFDCEWNKMPFTTSNSSSVDEVEKPKEFHEMIEIAKILSNDLAFVRVDLYLHNERIFFGELTFYPAGGYTPITPREWEYILGNQLLVNS